jgi:hypothetical protein
VKIRKHIFLIWGIGLLSAGLLLFASIADGFQINPEIFVPFALGYTIIGGLIAARHPENAIGWLLLIGFLIISANDFMDWYANMGFQAQPGSWSAANIFANLRDVIETIGIVLIFILPFLLFPNGRLLSRRWIPVLWLVGVSIFLLFLEIFRPGPLVNFPDWDNPLGIEQMTVFFKVSRTLYEILLLTLLFICPIQLILRYRSATIIERQQIKWFAFAASVASFSLFISLGFAPASPFLEIGLWILINTSLLLAMAIAILRYNLWDIDLIIRRTVQYVLLTGLLALVYFGSVVVLQGLIGQFTGEQSPAVIVISTLAIVVLFNPLRTRIQDFIDRRFYRQKYDAERALEEFAATARDEVDMDRLTDSLLGVIDETLQPEKVSIWLPTEQKMKTS